MTAALARGDEPTRAASGVPAWMSAARAAGAWHGARVTVAGIKLIGTSATPVLRRLGAAVTAVDDGVDAATQERAARLEALGATVRLGDAKTLPADTDLLVVSPGFRPDGPLIQAARAAGVPVWGDVELAYRLRPDQRQPWLAVTGTDGKTTTVQMLDAMLRAAGYRSVAAGNVGLPLLDAALAEPAYDVLAVELSSFQLHYTSTVRFAAAALLNVAPDHLDWHGSMEAYAADKAKIWRGSPRAIFNADDAWSSRLAESVLDRSGFTLRVPGAPGAAGRPGCLGVLDGRLVDRCFGTGALADVSDVVPAAPHNVANALAAAGLALALGDRADWPVPPRAVRDGLRAFRPDAHRLQTVAQVGGVDYVDDSKATNAHAAQAALESFPSVVWVAGGLAKGAVFDELVRAAAHRLRAAVLLGRDRDALAGALARHAPEVPVIEVAATDTGAMSVVVRAAARLARPGDTVLLAPACASMDMFSDYKARGDAFAAAARSLAAGAAAPPAVPEPAPGLPQSARGPRAG